MSQSAYSWCGTRLHFVLEDDFADAHNRAQDAFHKAQIDFKDIIGRPWWPGERIEMDWTDEEMNAFNKVADVINLLIEINGGSFRHPKRRDDIDSPGKVVVQKPSDPTQGYGFYMAYNEPYRKEMKCC